MGRLPLHHLPRRRRGRARQPQREADDPLLPRGRRGGAGATSRTARVIDGEIVVRRTGRTSSTSRRSQQRIHPAASRVKLLAEQTPAAFVAFDLLALGDEDLIAAPVRASAAPAATRRSRTVRAAGVRHPGHRRPGEAARRGSTPFEGAGLDGLIAKPADDRLRARTSGVMFKVKHERTADCVVAGFRWHKSGDERRLAAARPLRRRRRAAPRRRVARRSRRAARAELFDELRRCRTSSTTTRGWTGPAQATGERTPALPGALSRWNGEARTCRSMPLRPERVVEVGYDDMEGDRFRHTAQFVRWRPDRDPRSCTLRAAGTPGPFQRRATCWPSGVESRLTLGSCRAPRAVAGGRLARSSRTCSAPYPALTLAARLARRLARGRLHGAGRADGSAAAAAARPVDWQACPRGPGELVGRGAPGMTYDCAHDRGAAGLDRAANGKTFDIALIRVRADQPAATGSARCWSTRAARARSGVELAVYLLRLAPARRDHPALRHRRLRPARRRPVRPGQVLLRRRPGRDLRARARSGTPGRLQRRWWR